MYPKSNNMNHKVFEVSTSLTKMEFGTKELQLFLIRHGFRFWSWGATNFWNVLGRGLLFKVNGHHHKGYVLIGLDYSDTFDVYFISTHGNVVDEKHMVYIDMLFDIIDERIEKIPEYVR